MKDLLETAMALFALVTVVLLFNPLAWMVGIILAIGLSL